MELDNNYFFIRYFFEIIFYRRDNAAILDFWVWVEERDHVQWQEILPRRLSMDYRPSTKEESKTGS